MWPSSSSPSTIRRAGAREVGRGVDGDDPAGAECSQLVAVHLGLAVGDLGVEPARHHDHDVRRGGRDHLPAVLLRVLAGEAEHVLAAGVLDQLRRPMAGGVGRVEPLERDHARALGGRAPPGGCGRSARRIRGSGRRRRPWCLSPVRSFVHRREPLRQCAGRARSPSAGFRSPRRSPGRRRRRPRTPGRAPA